MANVLGIDGGGTRTTAWLGNERGKVLARAVAGPSNPLKVGFNDCQHQILRAAKMAMRKARQGTRKLDAVVVGLAGVDRPPVYKKLDRWLRKAIPARHHLLTSDAAIAMYAAIGDKPGIIVISGTGSISYGRDDHGHVLRSSTTPGRDTTWDARPSSPRCATSTAAGPSLNWRRDSAGRCAFRT
jgi:N-acetylglucosamine kinase-like BadF-type ATPase